MSAPKRLKFDSLDKKASIIHTPIVPNGSLKDGQVVGKGPLTHEFCEPYIKQGFAVRLNPLNDDIYLEKETNYGNKGQRM